MSIFTKHPQENDMTYWKHLVFAMQVGSKMLWGGLACIFHAVVPCCFETTASDTIRDLNKKFEEMHASSEF
jgi:hypothetical protein